MSVNAATVRNNRSAIVVAVFLFDPGFAAEHQRLPTSTAQITTALLDQTVALRREGEVAVRAGAAIDIARGAAAFDCVGVATIGRQLVDATHDQLPFLAVGRDTVTKQLMGNQVCDFVGDGLLEEVVTVFAV